MRRSTLAMCALLAVATSGCDKVQELVDKIRGREPATVTPPDTAPGADRGTTAVAQQPETPRRPVPQYPTATAPLRDEPFVSDDTGTIDPGMSESDVYSLWGPPAAVRRTGSMTFLFFRNGCEYSCGTMDLVILENGAVVDAVLRWEGHRYSGQSSSPPGTVPLPTRGGDTLVITPPAAPAPSPDAPEGP